MATVFCRMNLFWLLAMSVGCYPDPDFTTRHGIDVFTNGLAVDRYDIECATEYYISIVGAEAAKSISQIVATWEPAPFECTYSDGTQIKTGMCSGTQYYEYLHMVWNEDLHKTSFVEEVTHWVLYSLEGDNDYGHKDALWIVVSAINNSVWLCPGTSQDGS